MKQFFARLDPRGPAMALWVVLAMLLLAWPAWWSIRQIHLDNDVAQWLPAQDEGVRVLDWYHGNFPAEDRLIVSWDGSSLTDPRVERLARRLEGASAAEGTERAGNTNFEQPLFEQVVTPQQIIDQMTDRGVDRGEALRRLQGVIVSRGPSSGDGTSEAGAAGPVGLLVTLSESSSADEQPALAAIRRAADEVGIDGETLHLGGQPVAGSELDRAVRNVVWNPDAGLSQIDQRSPLLLSGLVAVLLAFFMLRSARMAVAVLAVTFYATFLTVALIPATGGSMNMVLVVMPTLLMVLTLSAAIHVANYWKHAAQRNLRTAAAEAVRMARLPCTLASLTTAIGLVSLSSSPLQPVREFGLYAAVGCLVSLAMVLWVLPSLLQFWPANTRETTESGRCGWKVLGEFLSRRRTAVAAVSLVVLAAATCGLSRFQTETKVIRYFPDTARVVRDYEFLEENLTGIVPVETVIRFDQTAQQELNFLQRLEVVRRAEDGIRQHPAISGTLSLADFQPVYEPLPAEASRFDHMLHARKIHQIETQARQETAAARAFLAVAGESADLAVRGDQRLNKAGDELWRITAQASILSDLDYAELTGELNQRVASELRSQAGADHVVTGMVPLLLRTQQAVLESLIRSFGLAFLSISLMMMFQLRNPLAGLMAMLPNLLPIGAVFGLVSWCGIAVDIGTMITASVALGITVDATLHLLTWFQGGLERGLSRRDAVADALAHAGPAIWQTSAAVGFGLLMLAPTELLLVSRFGWLMAALIGTALLATLLLLPALLAGPLGALIAQTIARRQATAAGLPETAPAVIRGAVLPHPRPGPAHAESFVP